MQSNIDAPPSFLSRSRLALGATAFLAVIIAIFVLTRGSVSHDPERVFEWLDRFSLSAREQRVPSNSEIQEEITHIGNVDYISKTHGYSLLTYATVYFNDDMVEWLLEQGANPNSTKGPLPLHIAVGSNHPTRMRIAAMLLEHGADPNQLDLSTAAGNTALHAAVYWRSDWAILLLASSGADLSKRNALNKTPLDLALERGDKTTIEVIESLIAAEDLEGRKDGPEKASGVDIGSGVDLVR